MTLLRINKIFSKYNCFISFCLSENVFKDILLIICGGILCAYLNQCNLQQISKSKNKT